MHPLSKFQITLARHIAARPEEFHQSPEQFAHAWAVLKPARGQQFTPERLVPAHLIGPAAPDSPPPPAAHMVQAIARRAA